MLPMGCNLSTRSSSPGPEDPDAPTEFTTTDSG
ncbi:MAG: FKBP-type peptidylprolyl isomerase, partial [Rhodopirellula sp.]|nr:FKBP-type peptidylprolyl isomerase [Rhodopirellula sp.]